MTLAQGAVQRTSKRLALFYYLFEFCCLFRCAALESFIGTTCNLEIDTWFISCINSIAVFNITIFNMYYDQ